MMEMNEIDWCITHYNVDLRFVCAVRILYCAKWEMMKVKLINAIENVPYTQLDMSNNK